VNNVKFCLPSLGKKGLHFPLAPCLSAGVCGMECKEASGIAGGYLGRLDCGGEFPGLDGRVGPGILVPSVNDGGVLVPALVLHATAPVGGGSRPLRLTAVVLNLSVSIRGRGGGG